MSRRSITSNGTSAFLPDAAGARLLDEFSLRRLLDVGMSSFSLAAERCAARLAGGRSLTGELLGERSSA